MSNNTEISVQIDDDCLCCPKCNNNYLHQIYVEVWSRHEDSGHGLYAGCSSFDMTTPLIDKPNILNYGSLPIGNPSSRRQGIRIHFYCEFCEENIPKLCIYQHKGITIIDWQD